MPHTTVEPAEATTTTAKMAPATSTSTMTHEDVLTSQYLSNSLSSLSASRSQTSLITKTYRQATSLYLTRRLKEALETVEPIITSQQSAEHQVDGANSEAETQAAPVAQASRGTRVKVWVFYLSLLNAIIELGPEEGKLIFGSTMWRQLAGKAREGSIWQDIVDSGYGGIEGDVDGDVVVNLATLLLSHMPSQKLNQSRLETYLSTSPSASLADSHVSFSQDGASSPNPASTPKELATRLKLLELYTLHVLPQNEEWSYAREFIEMNDSLDEERREAFVIALQSLKEEKDGTAQRERELKEQQERELREAEDRRLEEARKAADERSRQAEAERQRPSSSRSDGSGTSGASAKVTNGTAKPAPSASPTGKPAANGNSKASQPPSSRPAKPQKKPPTPPPTFYRRASLAIGNMHRVLLQASRSMTGSSMALLRFLLFALAFVMIIARQDLRQKIRRALGDGFAKIKQTVGMGVKVSYI